MSWPLWKFEVISRFWTVSHKKTPNAAQQMRQINYHFESLRAKIQPNVRNSFFEVVCVALGDYSKITIHMHFPEWRDREREGRLLWLSLWTKFWRHIWNQVGFGNWMQIQIWKRTITSTCVSNFLEKTSDYADFCWRFLRIHLRFLCFVISRRESCFVDVLVVLQRFD